MKTRVVGSGLSVIGVLVALMTGCGYHVGGKADLLPKNLKTIAIPAFANITSRYKLSQKMPAAITREFITRTRYQIIADPRDADAVLTGTVVRVTAYPVTFDQTTGRASAVEVFVSLQVTLRDRGGTVLYTRPNLEFRDRYEISVDPKVYLEENEPAMDRLSRDVARTVVSSVLEAF